MQRNEIGGGIDHRLAIPNRLQKRSRTQRLAAGLHGDDIQGVDHGPDVAAAEIGQAKIELPVAHADPVGAGHRLAARGSDIVNLRLLEEYAHLIVGRRRIAERHDHIILAVRQVQSERGVFGIVDVPPQVVTNVATQSVHRADLPAVTRRRIVALVRRMPGVSFRDRRTRRPKVESGHRVGKSKAANESIIDGLPSDAIIVLVH